MCSQHKDQVAAAGERERVAAGARRTILQHRHRESRYCDDADVEGLLPSKCIVERAFYRVEVLVRVERATLSVHPHIAPSL